MNEVIRKRCANHVQREAVAQCPECRKFFCRECVTEHEDRVLCSGCLEEKAAGAEKKTKRVGFMTGPVIFITGFIILWFCFYMLGNTLLKLPASFHEGTLWQDLWWK